MTKMITLAKGGTDERTVPIEEIHVPDLWHVAQAIRKGHEFLPNARERVADAILECWHLAHSFKRALVKGDNLP